MLSQKSSKQLFYECIAFFILKKRIIPKTDVVISCLTKNKFFL